MGKSRKNGDSTSPTTIRGRSTQRAHGSSSPVISDPGRPVRARRYPLPLWNEGGDDHEVLGGSRGYDGEPYEEPEGSRVTGQNSNKMTAHGGLYKGSNSSSIGACQVFDAGDLASGMTKC